MHTEVIFAKAAIARIIANTCRQHGLSQVLMELFDFGGDELYLESVPEMVGKTMQEAVKFGTAASAITVTRIGAADSIPAAEEVQI